MINVWTDAALRHGDAHLNAVRQTARELRDYVKQHAEFAEVGGRMLQQ